VIQGVRQLQLHYTYPKIFKKPEIKPVVAMYVLNEDSHTTMNFLECRMNNNTTELVDQIFEREPEDGVNVASFVKDICKIGYHPIFYANVPDIF
jgi:hypothetical protein